jgi:glycosyltransferase involved in cell wall biosynthesis
VNRSCPECGQDRQRTQTLRLPEFRRRFISPVMTNRLMTDFQRRGAVRSKCVPSVRASPPDLICYSHLRWDFVYQRPQHLLSRFARDRRVFFIEEPIVSEGPPRLELSWRHFTSHPGARDEGVWVAVPHVPQTLDSRATERALRGLLDALLRDHSIRSHIAWYYSPMALGFSCHIEPTLTIYDCMDELSAFLGAPAELRERERELFDRADLVFTGGQSLYEAKRGQHSSVHAFPSSIDANHFGRARADLAAPDDQAGIARPRLGYFGVIDERIDLELLAAIADARPDWQIVMIGPVVKISGESLPRRPNIHYLGKKPYAELPAYIAGWDVAIMPFARNDATRFISPTKTPEYLAAGRPVVSTSIRDVVRPYGLEGLVAIADEPAVFVATVERELQRCDRGPAHRDWLARVDACLASNSWDSTWARMHALIEATWMGGRRCSTI